MIGDIPLLEYLKEKEGHYIFYQVTSNIVKIGVEAYPHHSAAYTGNLSALEWFFSQGVPVDLASPTMKWTTLHWACCDGPDKNMEARMFPVVRCLVETHHANIHLRTHDGKTAADMAKRSGRRRIEAYLRKKELELGDEEMRQATAASEAARAALLAEVDAEEAAAAAAAGKSTKKKKKDKKKNKGGKKQDEQEEEEEEDKEEKEARGGGDGGSDGDVAGRLQELSIAETAATTTTSTAQAPAADDIEEEEEGSLSPSTASATTTTTTTSEKATAAAADEQQATPPSPPPPPPTTPLSLEEYLLQHAPDANICPISHCLFKVPVLAMDGHTYERHEIEAWFATCARKGQPVTSPKTNALMEPLVVPNHNVRAHVDEYIERKTKEWEEMMAQEEEEGNIG
jgi:sacsin